jgi:hypothetical protein
MNFIECKILLKNIYQMDLARGQVMSEHQELDLKLFL